MEFMGALSNCMRLLLFFKNLSCYTLAVSLNKKIIRMERMERMDKKKSQQSHQVFLTKGALLHMQMWNMLFC